MTVLITGATGLLGRHLARVLSTDHDVIGVCRPGREDESIAWVEWDMTEPMPIDRFPGQVDAIFHLAQSNAYRDFPQRATEIFTVNTSSTAALLEYGWRAGASNFILASSGNVYDPYEKPLTEETPVQPNNYYGASKLAAESLLASYGSFMNVSALRFFFIYGPNQVGRLIPALVTKIREGQPITLAGSGDGLCITPTHVSDVAEVVAHALEGNWNGIINVAGSEVLSIRRIGEMIAESLGREATFENLGGDEPRPIVPDLTLLKSLYDPSGFIPFEAGFKHMVADE